jgi:hypothetical protein
LPPAPSQGPAWEQQGPFFNRIIDTAREVLFRPREFFRAMPKGGGFGQSLLFYVITATVGMLASVLFQLVISSMGNRDQTLAAPVVALFMIVFVPLILIVSAFISAGIYHLMLMLLGAARHPYETTFRVVTYSAGATSLLGIIPICGGIVGAIWQIVAVIIGLAEAQETTTGKAAVAVLVPALFCCVAAAGLLVVAFTFGLLAALAGGASGARPIY